MCSLCWPVLWCLPELWLTQGRTCLETLRKTSVWSNSWIKNYNYYHETGQLCIKRQNPNLIVFFIVQIISHCPWKTNKLSITRKEDFKINSTFRSDFLVYLELLKGDKSDSSISRLLILGFYYFYYFLPSLWLIITYLGQIYNWAQISLHMGIYWGQISFLALTNVVNTASSCCIIPRIQDKLLVSFFRTLFFFYFSPFDTNSPFKSSSSFAIIPRQNTWNHDCNTPFAFFYISEPKTKANDSKKKVRRQWGLKTDPKLHEL